MAPHTPNLTFSFLACAYSLRLRQQAAMVAPPRFARRQIVGAIRDKNFVLVSKPHGSAPSLRSAAGRRLALELLTSSASRHGNAPSLRSAAGRRLALELLTSSASRHGNAPSLRSAAGRRLALELLTSSASQPPHSYLKASIGSMRAALFAG